MYSAISLLSQLSHFPRRLLPLVMANPLASSSHFCRHSSAPLAASQQHKMMLFQVAEEVKEAIHTGRPVVALESALITHGLAHPLNLKVALGLELIVRNEGAIPATIALMDGQIRVGLSHGELERISAPDEGSMKVSLRDVVNCLGQKRNGGTTVAATMWIAHRVGIKVFGTGGIGGVHRGAEQTMDISADLVQLGRSPVAVVCAGVKSILDVGKTLEFLETQSVNVLVFDKKPNFPGFFSPRTEYLAPHCTESLEEVAQMLVNTERLGLKSATLLACPMPQENQGQGQKIENAIQNALAEANQKNIRGKQVTPFVLKRVGELSGEESVRLNICLLENNARIAARLAVIFSHKKAQFDIGKNAVKCDSIAQSADDGQKCRKVPRIVCCIGAAIVDFEVLPAANEADNDDKSSSSIVSSAPIPDVSGQYISARIVQRPGGVARNHADALTRLGGCQVQLLTALGCNRQAQGEQGRELDPGAMFLLQRGAHMDWSQILHCLGQPTACSVGIGTPGGRGGTVGRSISHGYISVDHLMAHLDAKYIDSKANLICDADFVLMDANLSVEAIRRVQHWADKAGTKIWLEPTNSLKVPKLFEAFGPNPLQKVDIFSPNLAELREFMANLSGGEEKTQCEEFLKGFEAHLALSPAGQSLLQWFSTDAAQFPLSIFPRCHLLLTCDRLGVLLLSREHNKSSGGLAYNFLGPPHGLDQIVSVSGAGDCFNAGFLTGQMKGLSAKDSLELGRECARESLHSAEAVPETIGHQGMERKGMECEKEDVVN